MGSLLGIIQHFKQHKPHELKCPSCNTWHASFVKEILKPCQQQGKGIPQSQHSCQYPSNYRQHHTISDTKEVTDKLLQLAVPTDLHFFHDCNCQHKNASLHAFILVAASQSCPIGIQATPCKEFTEYLIQIQTTANKEQKEAPQRYPMLINLW